MEATAVRSACSKNSLPPKKRRALRPSSKPLPKPPPSWAAEQKAAAELAAEEAARLAAEQKAAAEEAARLQAEKDAADEAARLEREKAAAELKAAQEQIARLQAEAELAAADDDEDDDGDPLLTASASTTVTAGDTDTTTDDTHAGLPGGTANPLLGDTTGTTTTPPATTTTPAATTTTTPATTTGPSGRGCTSGTQGLGGLGDDRSRCHRNPCRPCRNGQCRQRIEGCFRFCEEIGWRSWCPGFARPRSPKQRRGTVPRKPGLSTPTSKQREGGWPIIRRRSRHHQYSGRQEGVDFKVTDAGLLADTTIYHFRRRTAPCRGSRRCET